MTKEFDTIRKQGSLEEPLDLREKISTAEHENKVPADRRDTR